MKRIRNALLAVLALAMCACASLSFDQKLAYGLTLNAETRQAATTALEAHKIDSATAQRVLTITDQSRGLLDSAASNKDASKLDMSLSLMKTLAGYLK